MPKDGELDVATMTREQLAEALENVDGQVYPENHRRLVAEWARRGHGPVLPGTGFDREARERAETREYLRQLPQRPPVVLTLVAMNAASFGVFAAATGGWLLPSPGALIHFGSNYTPATLDGEPWRLFTATFLHYGIVHLALNLWALWSLGVLTEHLFGRVRFLMIYLGAGLAGSVASVWWHPVVNSVGASGSIMGMFGALLAFLLLAEREVPAPVRRSLLGNAALSVAAIAIAGLQVQVIDNAAHFGGLLAGFALGTLLADGPAARATGDSRRPLSAGVGVLAAAVVLAMWAIDTRTLRPRGATPLPPDGAGPTISRLLEPVTTRDSPESVFTLVALVQGFDDLRRVCAAARPELAQQITAAHAAWLVRQGRTLERMQTRYAEVLDRRAATDARAHVATLVAFEQTLSRQRGTLRASLAARGNDALLRDCLGLPFVLDSPRSDLAVAFRPLTTAALGPT